jgi:hypothetical protein
MFAMVFAFQLARQGGNERKKEAAPGLGRMSRPIQGLPKERKPVLEKKAVHARHYFSP